MKYLHLLFLFPLLFAGQMLTAQEKQYIGAQDSDPEAILLLKSLRKKYDSYKTMEAEFRLDIQIPGNKLESQQGRLKRQGDFVRFKLGDQEGIINGEAAYVIQHGNKEVMINNLPEPGEMTGMLTPQTLFSFYEGDGYVLALQGKDVEDGRLLDIVELKPVDRNDSEFTKLRLKVDQAKKELSSVEAFTRDGSRFTFHLGTTKGNVALTSKTFAFDKTEFPGYHVEDMRY